MKQINRKTKTKMIIVVNLFLIFALMTVSVYAWFASQVDNRVDAYDIQVESDNALELSFDEETWSGSLNLADLKNADDESVLDTMKFVEVTSNGTTFRIPQLTQKTNYAEVNTGGSWTTAVPNQDYIEFTLHMRSKDKLSVYLSSDSKASPASSVVTGATCGNPSSYASGANTFSKDCIVGALRVSYNNTANSKFIWITNPEFHLNNTIGSSDYTMDTNAGATTYADGPSKTVYTAGANFYWNNPKTHYYYSGTTLTTYTNTLTALPDTVSTVPTATTTKLAELTGTADANGYYYGETTFRIWIEGCDTEARRALVDGKFNLSLVLDTFAINN
ncbi:MAG: hypothetical protein IJC86_02160 [Clostridia bacterium]|nr:hypothetical protein [Clostridia bacterium]